jgi:putative FmdB family regulatory protein
MPVYEYRCDACREEFETVQPVHARPEDTVCPQCGAKKATRLMSAFASKIVGDHKPGFSEMKAYNMLNERMHKFAKLPPIAGKRANFKPNLTLGGTPSDGSSSEGSSSKGPRS